MTKRVAVTGYRGRVGQELLAQYSGSTPLVCDVREEKDVRLAIHNIRPDIIVHLAAKSDVDFCQQKQNENFVIDVNVRGTFNVCEAARDYGCGVVLLSTSQVFDGLWGNYNEKSKPHPKNFYGMSKWGAERIQTAQPFMKIIRTSYLFDYERLYKYIYPLKVGKRFDYPTFIYRSFMYVPHFVNSLVQYLERFDEMPPILHISGTDTVSWYGFVDKIAYAYGLNKSLVMSRNRELPDKSPRPHKAGLNVSLSKRLGLPQFSYLKGLYEMAGEVA